MTIEKLIKGDSTIQGVTVHCKNSNGYECWREYDSKGNMIHFKDSFGFERWREYDSQGNVIHCRDSNGIECWWDSKGNRIEDPNKIRELTLGEIAEKIGIPVESLRIRD